MTLSRKTPPTLVAILTSTWLGLADCAQAQPLPAALTVSICDDENEWPPYLYYERLGVRVGTRLAGYARDVIDEIFTRNRIGYHIDLIPWNRCQAVAIMGKEYQMVLNLSYSAERDRAFLLSRPYYSTTTYYYYSWRAHPEGLTIHGAADLRNHRVCGISGYNYTGYGFGAGEIDQGTKDFPSLIAKLHLGRCSLFLEKQEVMTGYAAIGKDYLADLDIGKAPVPGMAPTVFHIGVSRKFAHAPALKKLIDAELLKMEESGRLKELWAKAQK